MSFPKLELDFNPASIGTIKLDGVDLSKYVSAIEYKAVAGKLGVVKLTIVADVEACLGIDPANLVVRQAIMPKNGKIDSVYGRTRHVKLNG